MVAARRLRGNASFLESLRADYMKLLWSTASEIPQPYHVVKGFCLVCFWPLPTSQGFQDPTFQISGLMMHTALQNMLHRPIQNSILSGGMLPLAEQRDRDLTWTACNVVAERYVVLPSCPLHFTSKIPQCFQYLWYSATN